MSEIGIRSRVLVKDIMSRPVTTIIEDSSAIMAAQLMDKHNIGSVIVTSKEGEPIGMITERDLMIRVVAKDVRPTEVSSREVMTAPLATIDSEESISNAARRMSKLDIRRLGVIHKGKLVGIISSKDVLAVTPELIEIFQEKAKIEESIFENDKESTPMVGVCDSCEMWSDSLKEFEGNFLCEECKTEL